jgi:hypothetical protein
MILLALAALAALFAMDGPGAESSQGLDYVSHEPLQARQTYQMVVHKQGDRWLLYLGHLRGTETNPQTKRAEPNGSSVVDVTDPAKPRYLRHIPPTPAPWFKGEAVDATGGQHVQLCDGDALPAGRKGRTYLLRNQGAIAQEVLDVTDPLRPSVAAQVVRTAPARDGKLRTHKNYWDCATGQAYLVGSVAGWTGQIVQIFDLSNPEKPRHIRDFGLPGTQPGGDSQRDAGFSLHEATVHGDRVYLTYGVNHDGVIQILDRKKLIEGDPNPTDASLTEPQIARLDLPRYWGAHSAKPILDIPIADYARNKEGYRRNFLFVTSEGIDFRCATPRHISFFIDMTDERHPWPVSNFQVPALPAKAGYPDFCDRGVFGPHSPHATHDARYEGKLLFLSYFTGGVRVIDMRNPFAPVEVGHFIQKATPASRVIYPPNAAPDVLAWPVANTVEVDPRGDYVYVADRPHNGLYVVRISGKVAEIAGGR